MKNEKILYAMGKISDELIENAAIIPKQNYHTAVLIKWAATAACLCLALCGLFLIQSKTPIPSIGEDPPVISTVFRGPTEEPTIDESAAPNNSSSPNENSEKINIYQISLLDMNAADIQSKLSSAGWANTVCTVSNEYGFVLKGSLSEANNSLSAEECTALAKAFMDDSGLNILLTKHGVTDFAYASTVADGLVVTYCYFVWEGEQTGAYIRFIFEDHKNIGEVQAHIYSSKCIDTLPLLSLDDAVKTAYKKNSSGKLEEINAADYRIQNEKLIYINGLPYYRFHGYGRNTREFIDGFALAVNIAESVVSDELFKQHAAFRFE